MRQKSDTVTLFEQFWANKRVADTPAAIELVRSHEEGNCKGDFAKLFRRHIILQEFTADSANFNGVAESHIAMIESAGMAAQVQAKSLFRAFKISSGSSVWSARNY